MLLSSFFEPGIMRRLPVYLIFLMTLIQFGVEGSLSGNIQASAQWQDPRGSKLGILTAISTLGNMAGNLTAPYFTDRLGRKGSLLIGACGTVLFVALQSAAQNLNWYLASRFFLGFFLLFCHNASPAFLSEFAPTKERTTVLSCYSPFYFVGAIVISWTCYSTVNWTNDWSWRAPSLVQAVPALIQIAAWPFIPESPRWLALHGKSDEALGVLVRYHGCGVETEAVRDTLQDITDNAEKQHIEQSTSRWKDLFQNKSFTMRTTIAMVVGIASQWSGNGLISYYIVLILNSVGITDGKTQTLFNGMLNVWSLLFCVGIAFAAQKIGRRPIILVGISAMLAVWSVFTGLSAGYAQTGSQAMAGGVLAMIYLFNAAYGAAWSSLFMYPVEMWPSGIRAKALAAQNVIDYLGLFFNAFVNPIAMDAIAWKYYTVYIVLLAAQLVFAYFTFPETRGLSNEEICDYWDGQVGPVKWTNGPKSKKLLLESQQISRRRRAAQRIAADGTGSLEEDVKLASTGSKAGEGEAVVVLV
ncbi:hypothetical protein Rhopal_007702-T1 [Rhodotorula paludigena]|uniref:Major facilitator superfamily (MFS) profile domain-containing protein n=1 Tax=Rhodotorula paludigena TaxID=86838 RepID=A0AAV5GXD4_9BASI|nr:hypothetical protein Rhopal_007702-T1 [Rhodotorula paludigena]